MAECHPVGFRWVMEAKTRGATIIHVDPRIPERARSPIFTFQSALGRTLPFWAASSATSSKTTDFSRVRCQLHQRAGVSLSNSKNRGPERSVQRLERTGECVRQHKLAIQSQRSDPTLQDPNCVFQIVRRHFSRYTPQFVEAVCGVPQRLFLRVAETLCANSGRDRTSAFCYAVGWTQHSVGVQYIRTAAIIQLFSGTSAGPVVELALRGHASIQGSTDIPTLFNLLPGYLPMPKAENGTSRVI